MASDFWADLRENIPQMKREYERLGQLIALVEGRPAPVAQEESPVELNKGNQGSDAEQKLPVSTSLGRDAFVGLSTAKAIVAFLEAKGKGNPQGPKTMAQALVNGGQIADADKAYANVQSSLKRMNKAGQIRQVRRGEWGLAAWYGSAPKKSAAKTRDEAVAETEAES